ncbi:hypothetical protein P4O66_004589 [Electrophorus voltai]|uniref:Uncharacterized protein n=1 Tax=Electrophorus voltai TaxID=2609070 RepID=A0AAD8ZLU8_9TELE|nr:hypothetical protein P4O66_004589 [Electrophorus voltai]
MLTKAMMGTNSAVPGVKQREGSTGLLCGQEINLDCTASTSVGLKVHSCSRAHPASLQANTPPALDSGTPALTSTLQALIHLPCTRATGLKEALRNVELAFNHRLNRVPYSGTDTGNVGYVSSEVGDVWTSAGTENSRQAGIHNDHQCTRWACHDPLPWRLLTLERQAEPPGGRRD